MERSWLSPRLEDRPRPEAGGHGVFAREPVEEGAVLAVWGGRILHRSRLESLSDRERELSLQVEEDHFLALLGPPDPADLINHSCHPNAGLRGQVVLVAMRAIAADEEVCFDYAMSESTPGDTFQCRCGAENCRGRVTAEDWTRPELQERYRGYFSPYLAHRIRRR